MLVKTTGGLRWHGRAFMQRKRWQATSENLADWLDQTRPVSSHLLLIGASAGWMMSGRWLQGFKKITVIDLDPLAPLLFRMNHGHTLARSGTHLDFQRLDAIAGLAELLRVYPDASVFFDNVLGQHRYRVEEPDQAETELNGMADRLQGRDWGSVHDLFSGPVTPSLHGSAPVVIHADIQDAGLVAGGLREEALQQSLLSKVGANGPWIDHLTSGVFPVNTRTRLISWDFLPGYKHWLQAGWVGPGTS